MKKMSTLPEESGVKPKLPVSRQLFFDDIVDPAQEGAYDNLSNFLQETSRIHRDNMSERWNFDFVEEKPLEGPFEWYRKDEDSWVGMKPNPNFPSIDDSDKFIPIEKENQTTPRVPTGDVAPVVRKRKGFEALNEKRTKRKISFD